MKILVSGGCGFIGSNVVNYLNNKSYDVTVIDNLKTGNKKNIDNNTKFINLDCSDNKVLEINEKFDCIIHIAGQASKEGSFDDVFYDLNSNTKSTLILLELCKKINC